MLSSLAILFTYLFIMWDFNRALTFNSLCGLRQNKTVRVGKWLNINLYSSLPSCSHSIFCHGTVTVYCILNKFVAMHPVHLCLYHRRSQDSVSGVHFFLPKKLTTFFSRRTQRLSKYTSKSNSPSKNVLKIDSYSGWGCTSCPGVHLHIFPVNYA